MTTRMFLIRHGSTTLTAEDRFAGSTDVPLGPDGFKQAERLAARLAGESIAAVYCSPMRRTIDTATVATRSFGLTPVTRDGLREMNHGRWEGLRRSEVEALYRDEYAAWEIDPFTFAPEGGESGLDVMARALPEIAKLLLSVAPLVKTISDGAAPTSAATWARASSTAQRAYDPELCTLEAFP